MSESSFEKMNMVDLGSVLRKAVGGQVQYLVRHFDRALCENEGIRYLGEGLRITGDAGNYHDMKIYLDDLPIAIERLKTEKGVVEKKGNEKEAMDTSLLPDWVRGK